MRRFLSCLVFPFVWLYRFRLGGGLQKRNSRRANPAPFRSDTQIGMTGMSGWAVQWDPEQGQMVPLASPKHHDAHRAIVNLSRDLTGLDVTVIFVDLSTSMSLRAAQIVRGYDKLRDGLPGDVHVILCGFNARLWLLYEGQARGMPRYQARHFALGDPQSMLAGGTAIYAAICVVGSIIGQLKQARSSSVVWITDGQSRGDTSTLEDARVTLRKLAQERIPRKLLGIVAEGESSMWLEQILRLIAETNLPDEGDSSAGASSSDAAGTFEDATVFIQGTLPPGLLRQFMEQKRIKDPGSTQAE